MHKLKLLPAALFALSGSVFAQQIPNAGSQLQQIPPVPVSDQLSPRLEIEQGEKTVNTETDTATIKVNVLRVDGATVYSEPDLIALTRFKPGSELSLSDLRAMAEKISDYYHDNGYFLARAYLPAQDIVNGAVTIAVIEGRVGGGGSELALVEGAIAGHAAVGDQQAARQLRPQRARWQGFANSLNQAFRLNPQLKALPAADTLICRCEDVPYAALADQQGWRAAKLTSRCGMGACQGRVCGAALHHLFGWQPAAPRPPFSPARIETLMSLDETPPA